MRVEVGHLVGTIQSVYACACACGSTVLLQASHRGQAVPGASIVVLGPRPLLPTSTALTQERHRHRQE